MSVAALSKHEMGCIGLLCVTDEPIYFLLRFGRASCCSFIMSCLYSRCQKPNQKSLFSILDSVFPEKTNALWIFKSAWWPAFLQCQCFVCYERKQELIPNVLFSFPRHWKPSVVLRQHAWTAEAHPPLEKSIRKLKLQLSAELLCTSQCLAVSLLAEVPSSVFLGGLLQWKQCFCRPNTSSCCQRWALTFSQSVL